MKGLKIIIAGGTGFIGQAICERWAKEHTIIVLTRNTGEQTNRYGDLALSDHVSYVGWDAKRPGSWIQLLEGADLLINLSGKSVNCRYTEANKAAILSSRVDATNALGKAITQLIQPPKLWINCSSATIYRHAEDRPQDEFTGEIKNDFSVQVCKAWEAAFQSFELKKTRKIALRVAITLGKGGVLVPFSRLVKCGLGGKMGNGKQMFSWIHIEDLCAVIEWCWKNERAEGIYNAAAPGPLPNREFMHQLRKTIGFPFSIGVPKWLLKIGAKLIGTETELLLKSRWVVPSRLKQEGFVFRYESVEEALESIFRNKE